MSEPEPFLGAAPVTLERFDHREPLPEPPRGYRYPTASEIAAGIASLRYEIAYARDEGNGRIYVTLKDTQHVAS